MLPNRSFLKVKPASRVFGMALILILAIALTSAFIQTDQVIASPSLRVLHWLWRVFVCQCPI
jgi:hypothetical protein